MTDVHERDLERLFAAHRDRAFAARTSFVDVVGASPAPRPGRRLRLAVGATLVVVVLGAAVATVAVRERRPHAGAASASSAGGPVVRIVAPDAAAAARVPVDGATALELRVVREELARLGGPSPIAFVRFDDLAAPDRSHPAPRRELVVRPAGSGEVNGPSSWLATRLAQVVLARLWAAGDRITWVGGGVNGSLVEAASLPGAPAPGTAALAALARQVTRGGVRLVHADVYPIGAVVARARLDEAAFLARRFEPAMAAFSPLDRATGAAVVTTLEAPDGSVLGSLGHAWNAGGGGGSTPQPADARPLLGPTVLDFSFQGGGLDGRAQPPLRIHLDCQAPSRSAGVADTVTACGTIMRRRYDLLAYALFEHSCVPLTNAPSVTIRGTLGGYPVRRDDDPCYVGDASARLAGVLGVPPTGWQPVSSGVLRAAIPPAWHAAALGGQAWLQLTTVRPAASRWDPTSSLRGGDVVVTVAPASGGGKALPAVVPLSAAQQVVGAGAPAGRTRYREEVDLGAGVVEIEVDVLAEPPALETLDTVDRILQTIQPTAGFGPAPTAGGRPVVLR